VREALVDDDLLAEATRQLEVRDSREAPDGDEVILAARELDVLA
jgi:hypothetical protein